MEKLTGERYIRGFKCVGKVLFPSSINFLVAMLMLAHFSLYIFKYIKYYRDSAFKVDYFGSSTENDS